MTETEQGNNIECKIVVEQAIASYKHSFAEFGDAWRLSPHRSVEMWLRGYNANEHNKKLFAACLDYLNTLDIDETYSQIH